MENENGSYRQEEQDRRIGKLEENFDQVCSHYNHEIGEVWKNLGEMNTTMGKIATNMDWLKRFFCVILTASVGTLITTFVGFLLKR